ncbi:MAG: hypothetical protein WCJ26_10570 [bacterium]
MRLSRLLFLVLLPSSVFFSSCEYKPRGDYFQNLSISPPSNVLIEIAGHSDTLIAINTQTYNVQVTCGNRTVLFYRLYIDGGQEQMEKCSNSFYIDPLNYIHKDGIYRMTIEVGINTGSGSIADALGAEGYLFQKDFILVVLRQQVGFYPELQFDRSGGKMKVTMDVPSNVQNVRKVVFRRSVGISPSEVFAEVNSVTRYEAYDPQYVGEGASYTVQTYIGDPSGTVFYPFVSGGQNAQEDLPVVTAGVSATGFPLLRWDKTHYASNCGGYRVFGMPENWSQTASLLATVSNIYDTVFQTTGVTFPGSYEFRVAAVPVQLPVWYTDQEAWNYYANGTACQVGLNSFYFDRFLSPEGPLIYYSSTSNVIYEYSIETGANTNMISTVSGWFYTFSVSPNGKYLLAATGASNFTYLLYDLTTHQGTSVPSSQVIGAGAETGIISVADNGIASIITSNKLVVYDFLHQLPITQQVLPTYGDRTVISADGQFIFAEAGYLYLYKLSGAALEQKWTSSSQAGTFKYYSFEPARPSKARIQIDQVMFTKDCNTLANEGSFVMDIDYICNIDFGNGHILGKTATEFKVLDLNTGLVQFQNPTVANSLTTDLRIKKNTVYHSGGRKLIIF